MRERLKDPLLWGSFITTILLAVKTFTNNELDGSAIDYITTSILSIVSMFGIINNPTNRKGL